MIFHVIQPHLAGLRFLAAGQENSRTTVVRNGNVDRLHVRLVPITIANEETQKLSISEIITIDVDGYGKYIESS